VSVRIVDVAQELGLVVVAPCAGGEFGWPSHHDARTVAPAVVDELIALGERTEGVALPEHDVVPDVAEFVWRRATADIEPEALAVTAR